jgi:hypothetical protein
MAIPAIAQSPFSTESLPGKPRCCTHDYMTAILKVNGLDLDKDKLDEFLGKNNLTFLNRSNPRQPRPNIPNPQPVPGKAPCCTKDHVADLLRENSLELNESKTNRFLKSNNLRFLSQDDMDRLTK